MQAVNPRIAEVAARHVHWVRCAQPLDAARATSWRRCCNTATRRPSAGPGALVVVMPRLGTVSPWASKATDIAHNCALPVQRIERVTEYRLALQRGLLGGGKALTARRAGRPAPRCCTTA